MRSREARRANDIGYGADLIAVSLHANRSKGDDAPDQYLPPRKSYDCSYVKNWIAVKYRWGLTIDAAEKTTLSTELTLYCTSLAVTKPGKPNIAKLVGTKTKHTGGGGGSTGTDPNYGTCANAEAHHAHTPYYKGVDPEYYYYEDRDHDGIVCE